MVVVLTLRLTKCATRDFDISFISSVFLEILLNSQF